MGDNGYGIGGSALEKKLLEFFYFLSLQTEMAHPNIRLYVIGVTLFV